MKNKIFVIVAFGLMSCGALSLQTSLANTKNDVNNSVVKASLSDLNLENYNLKSAEVEDSKVQDYDTENINSVYGIDESEVKESIKKDETKEKGNADKWTTHTNIPFDEFDENYEELEIKYVTPSGKEVTSTINTENRDNLINGLSESSDVSYSDNEYSYTDLAMSVMTQALKGNKEYASASKLRQEVILYAMQYVGNKYVYGGNSIDNGIDCSAFTRYVMKKFGVNLPRTSYEQRSCGKSVEKPGVGDLICYSGHVAIYVGDGKIIHASNSKPYPSGGVKVSSNYKYRTVVSIRSLFDE